MSSEEGPPIGSTVGRFLAFQFRTDFYPFSSQEEETIMKTYLYVAAIMLVALAAPASAQADGSIGVWRWLGLGWGPGYHAGGPQVNYPWHPGPHHHPHSGFQQPPAGYQMPANPQWQAPRETGPALQPIPEKSANLEQNLAPRYSPSPTGPAFPQNLESARRNAPLR